MLKELVLADERAFIAETLGETIKRVGKKCVGEYHDLALVTDGCFIADYFCDGCNSVKRSPVKAEFAINDTDGENSLLSENAVLFFADCTDGYFKKDLTLKKLDKVIDVLKGDSSKRCVVTVLLPEIHSFPGETQALSEREYNFFIEECEAKTPETDYYLEIEKKCKEAVKNGCDISLLRFDNCFAPNFYHTLSLPLEKIIDDCVKSGKITVTDEDYSLVTGVTYIREACDAVLLTLYNGEKGHIYNGPSRRVSAAEIKNEIFGAYPNDFSFSAEVSSGKAKRYNALSDMKIKLLGMNEKCDLKTAVKHSVSFLTEAVYDTSDNVAFYNGKIKAIQSAEIEILSVIDKICVENGIKYFLAGGTLLGAVRSGMPIEWDDDLDIGMLREDFDKFRNVCEKNLPEGYSYSSPFNKSGSHYVLDKVRIDGTYFSTDYSYKNRISDGVFVDIIVYDRTSNNKALQKAQLLVLSALYYCIILRWYNKARKGVHYGWSKVLLPILRIFPFKMYHKMFEFVISFYKNKINAHFLIDGVGKKRMDGAMPIDGLEDTVYIDFDGIKAPVPIDYTGYLEYSYGKNYMEKPVLGKRTCPHDFVRIDLGKYVFGSDEKKSFRNVDLRGELFETDK